MSSYTSAFTRRARQGLSLPPGSTHRLRLKLTTASAWVLPKETSAVAPPEVWSNKDLDPSPEEYRVWTGWTFFTCECASERPSDSDSERGACMQQR